VFERFNAATKVVPAPAEPVVDQPVKAGDLPSVSLDLKVSIHQRLIDKLNLGALEKMSREEVAKQLDPIVSKMVAEERTALNRSEYERLLEELLDEVLGLGPIQPLLDDNTVADILRRTPGAS
jgi:pilus assembly protein CpaF